MSRMGIGVFEEAFKGRHDRAKRLKAEGRRLLEWICTYVPEKVIIAAGLIPVRVGGGLGARLGPTPTSQLTYAPT